MAFSLKRILSRVGKTKPRQPNITRHRLRSEQLEPKLLLTRLFAVNTIDQLHEIDPIDGTVIKTLPLPLLDPIGEAVGYDGTDVWYATKTILYRLDPDTAAIREQWWLPRNAFRKGLAVTNDLIYMQNSSVFETLDVFDPETGTIIETLDLEDNNAVEDIPSFVFEGMAGLNGMVVFTGTDLTNEEILFLDPSTGVIVDRFDIDLDGSPDGLGVIGSEIHVGSGEDIVHVYDLDGTFVRDYQLSLFFDNVVGFGADGVTDGLFHTGSNDAIETTAGTTIEVSPQALLANDHIPGYVEGDWEIVSFTQPDLGSVTLDVDGDLVFDPEQQTSGSTSFEYVGGQKITTTNASDLSTSDWYGTSVAIDGTTSVVGAPLEDDGGSNAGAAYVNDLNSTTGTWNETVKLTADDASSNSQFGTAVSISDSTIVVGAWLDDGIATNAGAIYVFDRDANGQWNQSAKLFGSATSAGDHFGKRVDIDGDTIVVGAEQDDPLGSASGAAYVFQRNAAGVWQETMQLVASDGGAIDRFGGSVAIEGDTIAVGAYRASPVGAARTGAAYVFERNEGGAENWGETDRVAASDATTNDQFGISLDVDGGQLVVGAHLTEFNGPPFRSNAGSAYVFERDANGAWNQVSKLHADSPGAGDRFGSAVAIEDDVILVGAAAADVSFSDSGAAYAFQDSGSGYVQVRQLFDTDGRTRDRMGTSVAISKSTAIIGTPHGDATINNVGLAHVVDLSMSRAMVEVQISSSPNVASNAPDHFQHHINDARSMAREEALVSWKDKSDDETSWLEQYTADGELIEPNVYDLAIQAISG